MAGKSVSPKLRRDGADGFSLIEVLIAVAVTALVSVAVYTVYNNFFRQSTTQDITVEAQQNARVAINMMERELVNAGYNALTADVLTDATANSVEFIYTDPETDTTLSATAGDRLTVKYWLQTTGGIQYLVRKADNLSDGGVGPTEEVAPHVNSLSITYYDINGNQVADTSTQLNRNTVKFLTINLVTQTKSNIPGTNAPGTFMLETHIRLRNIGVGQASNDDVPPSTPPLDVQVRDPGQCGRLKVKWTKHTEGDVAGYKIYYGVASGVYEGVINVSANIMNGSNYTCTDTGASYECTIVPAVPTLAYTPSDGSSTAIYYLALKAYDNALNHSDFSTEVSGNPATSNPDFDSGPDDSTLNPVKPASVGGFSGADAAAEGQVLLSWSAYDTSADPDVTGFRIYRSTSPFSSYPVDPSQAGVEWIAGEPGSGKPEVAVGATSYTDPGPNLLGCKVYYYAIAPAKCDATLISDAGGDPNDKKYVQTDYDATCGDGVAACTAGSGFGASTGSDTAPAKSTAPQAPVIDARAGWKRVALSLTQPADQDLERTCIYVNESSAYPEILTDSASFPLISNCFQVDLSQTPDAVLIPDSNGSFTSAELAPAQSTSFWHDSLTEENPVAPALADTGTYSYRAVSFNLCGNGSNVSAAQATTVLCGEDPATGEKPPAVTGADASCCSSPVSLSWTPVPSNTAFPSGINNPYDLAGYRIFRSTSTDFSSATMISGSAPFWGSAYSDNTAAEGTTYYYKIISTDCPYERNNPSEATVLGDMLSGYLNSVQVGPVTPGRIDRDEKCPGAGSCTKDAHREVLTGVDIAANGSSTVASAQKHNTVTMFFDNTSSGTLTITGATVYWVNSSAYLREVKIGGGRSGMGAITSSLAAGLTSASGNSPYTRVVSNAALASSTVPATERYVPIKFTFLDASGLPVDMRDDQILITLNMTNDATSTTGCESYMTVSMSSEGIGVPFGPSITATQQDQPASPTFGYAVPGATGLNTVSAVTDGPIIVDGGATVTITSSIAGNTTDASTGTKVPVSSATLYYRATAKTVVAAPAAGYTAVAMTNTAGNTWTADIPANDNQRIWYYVVAADADGNWDRDPEAEHGAYVYDQNSFDVCDVTPSAPTGLTAVATGSDVALNWSAVTTYTNGGTVDASDTILYRIYRNGVQIGADQAGLSYSDTGLATSVYSYYVKAVNSCASPGPNVSAASPTAATCVGNNSQATLSVTPTSIYRGDSFTVTIVDCLAMRSDSPYTYGTTIETINTSAGFTGFYTSSTAPATYAPTIPETGASTGTFTKVIATTGDVSESGKLLTLPADTVTVYYPYASPTTKTVSVVVDPCTNTPKAPTGFTGSVAGSNMTLSWSAVTQNTDNSAITDLAGYRVYERVCAKNKPNCTGSDIVADWFLRTTTTGTSVTVNPDNGNLNQRIYYFKATAYDTCGTPNASGDSNVWNETN